MASDVAPSSIRRRVRPRVAGWGTIWIASVFPACTPGPESQSPPVVAPFVELASAFTTEHTCHGAGHSPPLRWNAADLPTGTTHVGWLFEGREGVSWAAWDAPAALERVQAHFPAAHSPPLQGTNHLGRMGWAPPCPPTNTLESAVYTLTAFAFEGPVRAPPTLANTDLRARLTAHAVAFSTSEVRVSDPP